MSRRLRVLFFVENPAAFWRYAPLVTELAGRGHTVRPAFDENPKGIVEELSPGVAYRRAPHRGRFDGWRPVANAVRQLADLARYAHPRYADASFLRERMASTVVRDLERRELEALTRSRALRLARRLAASTDAALSERVIAKMARYDQSIPTSGEVDAFIRDEYPDVVLVTPIMKAPAPGRVPEERRRAGVPTVACIKSWDELDRPGAAPLRPRAGARLERAAACGGAGAARHPLRPRRRHRCAAVRRVVRAAAERRTRRLPGAGRTRSGRGLRPLPLLEPRHHQAGRRRASVRRELDRGRSAGAATTCCAASGSWSGRTRIPRRRTSGSAPTWGSSAMPRLAARRGAAGGRGGERRILRLALPQRGGGRHQHDVDDRGGDHREERPDDPRATVRAGEHAALPPPARRERRLPARRRVARGARRAARTRAGARSRGRRAAACLRGGLRPAARARPACDADPRRRRRGSGDAPCRSVRATGRSDSEPRSRRRRL